MVDISSGRISTVRSLANPNPKPNPNWKDLEGEVFGAYSNEIKQFLEQGMLTYAMRVHAPRATEEGSMQATSQEEAGSNEADSFDGLKEIDMSSSTQAPYISHGEPVLMIDPMIHPTHQDKFAVATTWPNEWITAGSPRLHVAFEKVLKKEHLKSVYAWAKGPAI